MSKFNKQESEDWGITEIYRIQKAYGFKYSKMLNKTEYTVSELSDIFDYRPEWGMERLLDSLSNHLSWNITDDGKFHIEKQQP